MYKISIGWILLIMGFRAFGVEYPKDYQTAWKLIRSYSPRINPGIDIPQYSQFYTWKTTGKLGDVVIHSEAIPAYHFEVLNRVLTHVGSVKIETELKLEKFVSYGGRVYYHVPDELVEPLPNFDLSKLKGLIFVDGFFIYRDEANSFKAPAKISRKSVEAAVRPRADVQPAGAGAAPTTPNDQGAPPQ